MVTAVGSEERGRAENGFVGCEEALGWTYA